MLTVIETPTFSILWPDYWTEEERGEFAAWIAENPEAGNVVKNSGGCRKVRWSRPGSGKSGGVRVIYINRRMQNVLVLLLIYAKSANDNIPAHILKKLSEAIGHENE
jgi:hypothetical protein